MADILLMPFITDSPEFSYGFQCGQFWEKMSNGEVIESQPIHSFDIKQVEIMADHFGYNIDIRKDNDDWATLNAKPIDITNLQL